MVTVAFGSAGRNPTLKVAGQHRWPMQIAFSAGRSAVNFCVFEEGAVGPVTLEWTIEVGGAVKMFSHIFVGADDIAASKKFYDAVLGAIGVPEGKIDPRGRVFYRTPTGTFGITKPIDGNAATHANGGTIGFACDSAEKVKCFHDAGVASGGKSIEDPPGWRENGPVRFYLAYLRDPYGNKICALHRS